MGVSPVEPGFKKAKIKPFLGELDWAFGSVPIPSGRIDVDVRKKQDKNIKATVRLPSWVDLELDEKIEYNIIRD